MPDRLLIKVTDCPTRALRLRLWWMRARLDGRPFRMLMLASIVAAVTTLPFLIADPSSWPRRVVIVIVLTAVNWAVYRGWRTPRIDNMIRRGVDHV